MIRLYAAPADEPYGPRTVKSGSQEKPKRETTRDFLTIWTLEVSGPGLTYYSLRDGKQKEKHPQAKQKNSGEKSWRLEVTEVVKVVLQDCRLNSMIKCLVLPQQGQQFRNLKRHFSCVIKYKKRLVKKFLLNAKSGSYWQSFILV